MTRNKMNEVIKWRMNSIINSKYYNGYVYTFKIIPCQVNLLLKQNKCNLIQFT